MWVPKAKPIGVGAVVHEGSVVRQRNSRKLIFGAHVLARSGQHLADEFWIFGKVVLDVAEIEGAEDRFFRFALEQEFERSFDEALSGGIAGVSGEFDRADADFVGRFGLALLDCDSILCCADGLDGNFRFHWPGPVFCLARRSWSNRRVWE